MLRILAFETKDLVINGLMSALVIGGIQCKFLKPTKAIFDAFYEFQPNYFITYPNQLNQNLFDACKEFNVKCIGLKLTEGNICPLEDIPDLIGYKPKPAANLVQFKGIYSNKNFSEIVYINLFPAKPTTLNYLENFINWPKPYYLKIFGHPVPYVNYIGQTTFKDIGNILSASIFMLDLYNDLIFDAWMNGCIAIPYRSNPLIYPEERFGRYEEPHELENLLKTGSWGNDVMLRNKRWIAENHTYYHRAIELLKLLGHEECCQILNEKIQSLKSEY